MLPLVRGPFETQMMVRGCMNRTCELVSCGRSVGGAAGGQTPHVQKRKHVEQTQPKKRLEGKSVAITEPEQEPKHTESAAETEAQKPPNNCSVH